MNRKKRIPQPKPPIHHALPNGEPFNIDAQTYVRPDYRNLGRGF